MFRSKLAPILLAALGSSLACGDLGDDSRAHPLVVIEGQLSQTSAELSAETPANVRVAMIWSSNSELKSTHDVEVVPVFPSSFRLELREAPPLSAMYTRPAETTDDATVDETVDRIPGASGQSRPLNTGASSYSLAIGTIVAYEDRNGNGKLDLVNTDETPVDRILGANESLTVFYFEGTPPAEMAGALGSPSPGYNLLKMTPCRRIPSGGSMPDCERGHWLPITTLYELPLTSDPQLTEMMCASNTSVSEATATANIEPEDPPVAPGPNGWPSRDAEGLLCLADGKTYSMTRCETESKGLCKGTRETCTTEWFRSPSDPPPAEWPCAQ